MAPPVNPPLLSVIVPVYKVEAYLDRCLDSLAAQTYGNLEIILVDDGSPDRCPQMCDDRAKRDGRIKVVHQQNAGLGLARNAGLDIATGEYVAFVDSDDYLSPEIYSTLMAKAVEMDADIVSCALFRQQPDLSFFPLIEFDRETVIEKDGMEALAMRYLETMWRHDSLNCGVWHAVYRRSITAHRFLSERIHTPEDLFFTIQATLKANRYVYIPEPLYYYVFNTNSLSRSYTPKNFEGFARLAAEMDSKLSQMGIEAHIGRYIFSKFYRVYRSNPALRGNLNPLKKYRITKEVFSIPAFRSLIAADTFDFAGEGLKLRLRGLIFRQILKERYLLLMLLSSVDYQISKFTPKVK